MNPGQLSRRFRRTGITACLSLLFSLVLQNSTADEPILEKGDRVAIVGDSITEQKQYSKFIETYLMACTPQLDLQVFQFGWGGERAPGFASRQDNDLAFWKPDVITTCFGMNDGSYTAYTEAIGKRYEDGMRAIIDRFKKDGATFVIGGPGVVDSQTWKPDNPDYDQVYNENLKQLDNIATQLAKENGFPHATVFDDMMEVMKKAKAQFGDTYPVAGNDGVHPGGNGHLIMAYAFLKAMGLKGDIATITIDMASGDAKASEGHTIDSNKDGTTITSTRYPFSLYGDGKDPNATDPIAAFFPFQQDLNRFLLIVENIATEKAEVTWGEAKKTFTREQLKNGVNLAAEFPETPFEQAFAGVMNAVAAKQNFETPMIKDQISKFRMYPAFGMDSPEVKTAIATLTQELVEKDDALYQQVKAAVKPVTHKITVKEIP